MILTQELQHASTPERLLRCKKMHTNAYLINEMRYQIQLHLISINWLYIYTHMHTLH